MVGRTIIKFCTVNRMPPYLSRGYSFVVAGNSGFAVVVVVVVVGNDDDDDDDDGKNALILVFSFRT